MAIVEYPMQTLKGYLPEDTYEKVAHYLHCYKVHLTVTKARKTVLGDYRNSVKGKSHRISVNGNLNKYAFLITLLHELAHLLTYEKFGHRVMAHGKEWQQLYSMLLSAFVAQKIFPPDIEKELLKSMYKPAASSCAEEELTRIIKKYDARITGTFLLEELMEGAFFKTRDGRVFQKGKKLRKRYKCSEVATKNVYLFSAVYEVKKANADLF